MPACDERVISITSQADPLQGVDQAQDALFRICRCIADAEESVDNSNKVCATLTRLQQIAKNQNVAIRRRVCLHFSTVLKANGMEDMGKPSAYPVSVVIQSLAWSFARHPR